MMSALIGFTGLVGSHVASSDRFELLLNRSNLESLQGAQLDRLVCACLPGTKWIANQRPQDDAENMLRVMATLSTVKARRVVLMSTIDVYSCTRGNDEHHECLENPKHAYGSHRLEFERFIRGEFPTALIVRLPALFGRGLKKNVMYDLLHDNQLERINPASRFQWYPLVRLQEDLRVAEAHELRVLNLFPEPIATSALIDELFTGKAVGEIPDPEVHYDVHTCYGALFGGDGRYISSRAAVMRELQSYVWSERSRR